MKPRPTRFAAYNDNNPHHQPFPNLPPKMERIRNSRLTKLERVSIHSTSRNIVIQQAATSCNICWATNVAGCLTLVFKMENSSKEDTREDIKDFIRTSTGFEPVTSRYRCDTLTNWAMKPLTLGAGHLWVLMFPWRMNQRWNDILNCGYEIKWRYDPRNYRDVTGSNPVEVLPEFFRLL